MEYLIELSDYELNVIMGWAMRRERVKERNRVRTRKVSPKRGDTLTHYIGLKAEYAFSKLLGLRPDLANHPHGDRTDFTIRGGYTADIKVSRRDLFMRPGQLKSSIAVLANPQTRSFVRDGVVVDPCMDPMFPDPGDPLGWRNVSFVGWISESEFRQLANITTLGYGPVQFLERERLNDMRRLVNWVSNGRVE